MTNKSKFTVSKLRLNNLQSFTSYSTFLDEALGKRSVKREQSSRRICLLHFMNSVSIGRKLFANDSTKKSIAEISSGSLFLLLFNTVLTQPSVFVQ